MKQSHSRKISKTIISGADGPTSVFIAGKRGDKMHVPAKQRVRLYLYNRRRKKVISKIKAAPHTLDELVEYVKTKYNAVELTEGNRRYITQCKNCKSALMQRFHPNLLGEEFPFDYHLYQIEFLDYGTLDLEIEKEHQLMFVGYTSRPRKKKYMEKIAQDIFEMAIE